MTADDEAPLDLNFAALAAFLDSQDAPEDWMPAAMLDGFLAGVAVSPSLIPPSAWIPEILGETPFESEDQARCVLSAITARYNEIYRFVLGADDAQWEPWIGDTPQGLAAVRVWAAGFLQVLVLRREDWIPLLQDDSGNSLLAPFLALTPEALADDPGGLTFTEDLPDEHATYLAITAPALMRAIKRYWSRRNDDHGDNGSL